MREGDARPAGCAQDGVRTEHPLRFSLPLAYVRALDQNTASLSLSLAGVDAFGTRRPWDLSAKSGSYSPIPQDLQRSDEAIRFPVTDERSAWERNEKGFGGRGRCALCSQGANSNRALAFKTHELRTLTASFFCLGFRTRTHPRPTTSSAAGDVGSAAAPGGVLQAWGPQLDLSPKATAHICICLPT